MSPLCIQKLKLTAHALCHATLTLRHLEDVFVIQVYHMNAFEATLGCTYHTTLESVY